MKEEQTQANGTPAKNKKMIILICVFVVIIAGLVAVIFTLLPKKEETEVNEIPAVVDEDNAEDVGKDLDNDSANTEFHCRMTNEWTFADGKAKSTDAYVANSDTNRYPIYFEVRLADSTEVIYTSPTIPVNKELNGLTLEKELPQGDYDAEVMYHLVDTENNNKEVSSVVFTIVIHVLG